MAQDSIAYGESLLSDIRQRNDKLRSQQKKQARKDEWKSFAIGIGTKVADNYFQQQQENFRNNEQLMAQKLSMVKVDEEATAFNNTYKTAMKYDGGLEAWKRNEVKKLAAARLGQDYVEGTYNEADFNLLTNKVADSYYDTYSDEFDKRLKANQAYITSGNTDAFERAIESQAKSKGMTSTFLTKIGLGKIAGNPQTDLLQVNPYEKNANAQKIFQDQYNQTRDAGLSEFIAKEFSKEGRMKLGRPSIQVSEEVITIKSLNSAGIETESQVQQATQGRRDGSVERFLINLDGSRYSLSSVQDLEGRVDFYTAASGLVQNNAIQAGRDALKTLSVDDTNIISKSIVNKFTKTGTYNTAGNFDKLKADANDNIASYVTQGGIAAASQKWGTAKDGRTIQLSMIMDNLKSDNPKNMPITGIENPFETMFKIDAISSKLLSGNKGVSVLVANGVALYDNYLGLGEDDRKGVDDRFANMSFFKDPSMAGTPSRDRAAQTMEVVKIAVKLGLNPRDYGNSKTMLEYIDANLKDFRGMLNGKSNAAQTTQAVANATSAQGVTSLEELEAPVGIARNKRGQWTSPQHKDYAALGSAVEEMEEIEIKLADPRTANFAGATRNLKKRLAVAKANVVALRNAYTKTYL
jgi:hypothetical protein